MATEDHTAGLSTDTVSDGSGSSSDRDSPGLRLRGCGHGAGAGALRCQPAQTWPGLSQATSTPLTRPLASPFHQPWSPPMRLKIFTTSPSRSESSRMSRAAKLYLATAVPMTRGVNTVGEMGRVTQQAAGPSLDPWCLALCPQKRSEGTDCFSIPPRLTGNGLLEPPTMAPGAGASHRGGRPSQV